MPVLERDPWRLQYFEHVPCPEHVVIPTDDPDCWQLSPAHRWIYDKLKVAAAQGLDAGDYPVALVRRQTHPAHSAISSCPPAPSRMWGAMRARSRSAAMAAAAAIRSAS